MNNYTKLTGRLLLSFLAFCGACSLYNPPNPIFYAALNVGIDQKTSVNPILAETLGTLLVCPDRKVDLYWHIPGIKQGDIVYINLIKPSQFQPQTGNRLFTLNNPTSQCTSSAVTNTLEKGCVSISPQASGIYALTIEISRGSNHILVQEQLSIEIVKPKTVITRQAKFSEELTGWVIDISNADPDIEIQQIQLHRGNSNTMASLATGFDLWNISKLDKPGDVIKIDSMAVSSSLQGLSLLGKHLLVPLDRKTQNPVVISGADKYRTVLIDITLSCVELF